ncbi:MAG: prolyl oligopeptidase family serine peptidase [Gemmatimonadaceae bacterium]|nr:prolyl oligopeptidase family serine peptidase [Gemmatimonadaceae bacterium]
MNRVPGTRRRNVLCILALLCAGMVTGCGWRVVNWRPNPEVAHSERSFMSEGVRITVERMAPLRPGHYPAVLVLNPSSGTESNGGRYIRRYADQFALNGYVAYVVHYFDRTGTEASNDELEDRDFPIWTRTLSDAVTYVQHDSLVDSTRVGVFGYSLGAYMALALGAVDRRVKALVVLGGGFFDALAPAVKRLPPTLLLHGSDDDIVPLREARKVDATLARLGVAHELVVYPGEGHSLSAKTDPDVAARGIHFLDRHMRAPWWRRFTPTHTAPAGTTHAD